MKPPRDWKHGVVFMALGLCFAIYAAQGGFLALLGWPALSFAVVGIAYLTGDVKWFGKRTDGSRRLWATVALTPYLAFVHIVWRVWRRFDRRTALHSVNGQLIVSRRLLVSEYPKEVTHVWDLTCEFRDPKRIRASTDYRCLPILDAGTIPAQELALAVRAARLGENDCLLIHCANGHGRTGMVAAAWLIAGDSALSVDEAIERLQSVRPRIRLRPCQRATLDQVASLLR